MFNLLQHFCIQRLTTSPSAVPGIWREQFDGSYDSWWKDKNDDDVLNTKEKHTY